MSLRHKKLILIVDDEHEIRELFREALTERGYAVDCCANGQEALAFVQTKPCDLIITDVVMPEMNGLDFFENLKRRESKIPGIVISGFSTKGQIVRALRLGAFRHLEKPLRMSVLFEAVEKALEVDCWSSQLEVSPESTEDWVELSAPSDRQYIGRLENFLGKLYGSCFSKEECGEIEYAVREVLANAIEWGNQGDPEKRVKVTYSLINDQVVFKIEDQGGGFNAQLLQDPSGDPLLHAEQREAAGKRDGGWGLYLVRQYMDTVLFNEKGNAMIMARRSRAMRNKESETEEKA